jgi:hypothetical protein
MEALRNLIQLMHETGLPLTAPGPEHLPSYLPAAQQMLGSGASPDEIYEADGSVHPSYQYDTNGLPTQEYLLHQTPEIAHAYATFVQHISDFVQAMAPTGWAAADGIRTAQCWAETSAAEGEWPSPPSVTWLYRAFAGTHEQWEATLHRERSAALEGTGAGSTLARGPTRQDRQALSMLGEVQDTNGISHLPPRTHLHLPSPTHQIWIYGSRPISQIWIYGSRPISPDNAHHPQPLQRSGGAALHGGRTLTLPTSTGWNSMGIAWT